MTFSAFMNQNATQWVILIALLTGVFSIHNYFWSWLIPHLLKRKRLIFRMAARMRGPSRLIMLVLTLVIVVPLMSLDRGTTDILEHVAIGSLISAFGWMAILALEFLTERSINRLAVHEEEKYADRAQATQLRVLRQSLRILIVLLTAGLVLSTFESVRQYGVSLFASAGAAGLVLGFAARPVLANLIAGIQIALTQPIRLNDVVIVENEWGWIEEISSTYVVIRIWDLRRLVVPLSYFIEQPFQNWTRDSSSLIGSVIWYLDYTVPMDEMRRKLTEIVEESSLWDRRTVVLQVIDTTEDTIQVRGLVSARNAPTAWDLRCEVREKMIGWLQAEHPQALPRMRAELDTKGAEMDGSVRRT
ncbi:mechanosensitive ion channel family protein [Palleronia sp. LCG004]|uniref:mechanosensitive ion channel family protein n=1 Tax=Palleronia sp. LCG004 TaxID=3079304 RepID=UPI00294332B6|nr:mechanosensitive ion channel domain-containing protein [Palleronia sp. LCG004]WOI55836.1 mechanosensitive ion channel [Palleronia sp. LCG004]